MGKLNVIFYQLSLEDSMIRAIAKDLEKKEELALTFIEDYAELMKLASEDESALFVFRLKESEDLAHAVGILQGKKKAYKEGLFKSVCIHSNPVPKKVERLFRSLGCNEFFNTDANPRTVRFKLDFLSRGIFSAIKKKAVEERMKSRSGMNGGRGEQEEEESIQASFVKALEIESDIWILKAQGDYKKVLGRWLFFMIGPSSRVGHWEFVESKDKQINGCWKFNVDPEYLGKFIVDDGAWYFRGSKPDFDWKVSRWKFSSGTPELFFKEREGDTHVRFKLEDKNLIIAKNSGQAQLKEKEILETCDGRFAINNEKGEGGDLSLNSLGGSGADEDDLKAQGASSQDQSRLEGKNSQSKEAGALKGDQKEGSSNPKGMNGKGDTDQINGHLKGGVKEEDKKKKPELEANLDKEKKGKELGITLDKEKEGKELEAKLDEISDGEVEGKLKHEKAREGELKGKTGSKEYNQKEATQEKDEFQDNTHHLKKKEESGRLKGEIKPEEEAPVNLESGTVQSELEVNGKKVKAEFEDIMAEEIYLQVAKGAVAVNEKMNFLVSFQYHGQEVSLSGKGTVGEVENEEDSDMIIVDIEKIDPRELENFLKLYSQRQESISQFLNLAKGA